MKCRLGASRGHTTEEQDVEGIVLLGVAAAEYAEPPDAEAGEDEWFPFDFVDVVSAEDDGDCVAYHEGCLEDALLLLEM